MEKTTDNAHIAGRPEQVLLAALLAGEDGPPPPAWSALLEKRPEEVLRALRAAHRRPLWRAALRAGLPQWMLADLVVLSRPDLGVAVRAIADRRETIAHVLGSGWQRALWGGAFELAAQRTLRAVADLESACVEVLRAAAGPDSSAQEALLAAWRGPVPVTARVEPARVQVETPRAPAPAPTAAAPTVDDRPAPADAPASAGDATQVVRDGEFIYLDNAGLVLLGHFLPRLFAMLKLTVDGAFAGPAAAGRAVHLLQFVASGASGAPAHALPLNKLLCGLAPEEPVAADVVLTQAERQGAEEMLRAFIAQWRGVENSSADGLRGAFLMRRGRLEPDGQRWQIRVSHGQMDMLLDRLPWSFSTIRLPWMAAPLLVHWR
ncbi:contractile injection system tape measure protein [Massilia sp. CFBP9026]|uniref:contractile injection system tape measure protein n=1 Tax=Massilia sp. CFBP9026 TaxID=3096536 RepID=UPI002A699407|nr:contractile injection system tape measure protein [Massilia sp. CFBP9026]MDY0961170.1 contractile injection system tape measure protein [Massilia sp. CFBP9026]